MAKVPELPLTPGGRDPRWLRGLKQWAGDVVRAMIAWRPLGDGTTTTAEETVGGTVIHGMVPDAIVKVASHVSGHEYTCDVYARGRYDADGVARSAYRTGEVLWIVDGIGSTAIANGTYLLAWDCIDHFEAFAASSIIQHFAGDTTQVIVYDNDTGALTAWDLTEDEVLTDWQYDSTTKKFQAKTRNCYLINADAESAWTDLTGPVAECWTSTTTTTTTTT